MVFLPDDGLLTSHAFIFLPFHTNYSVFFHLKYSLFRALYTMLNVL